MFKDVAFDSLTIVPKPALCEWLNSVWPDDPLEIEEFGGHDSGTVYLIPEFDDDEEAMEWLRENFKPFFELQLLGWCTDETKLPPLTWDKFNELFSITYNSLVFLAGDEEE